MRDRARLYVVRWRTSTIRNEQVLALVLVWLYSNNKRKAAARTAAVAVLEALVAVRGRARL